MLVLLAVLLGMTSISWAGAPRLINYQGVLTDSGDLPLNGSYDLTFNMYPDSMPATEALWTEDHLDVDIDGGLFNVILGGSSTLYDGLFEYPELWMGVTVNAGAEMTPRMRITSVPWALRAAIADSLASGASGSDADWVIDGTDMYTGPGVTGNVGVGTTAPARKLHLRGGGLRFDRDANTAFISIHRFPSGDFTTPWKGFVFGVDAYGPNDGTFRISDWGTSVSGGSTTRFIIDNDGNVGIGTSAPSAKLDVAGTVEVEGFSMSSGAVSGHVLKCDASGEGTWQSVGSVITDDDWIIDGDDMYSAVSGDVGIGAPPSRGKLCVSVNSGNAVYVRNSAPSPNVVVELANEDYAVEASGNIPIYAEGDSISLYAKHSTGRTAAELANADYGVYGENGFGMTEGYLASDTYGVYGSSDSCGVYGYSPGSIGVMGECLTGTGVYGKVFDGRAAVLGEATATYGVHGVCLGNGNEGRLGGPGYGIYGHSSDDPGVWGFSSNDVAVKADAVDGDGVRSYSFSGYGVHSTVTAPTATGVYSKHIGSDCEGHLATNLYGAYGYSPSGDGVMGSSIAGIGVKGTSVDSIGVYGENTDSGAWGYIGGADYGVYAKHPTRANEGFIGGEYYAVYGQAYNAAAWAGYFNGGLKAKSREPNSDVFSVVASDNSEMFLIHETSTGETFMDLNDSGGNARVRFSTQVFLNNFIMGMLGVGTEAPTEMLTVDGNAKIIGNVKIHSASTGDLILELGEGLDYAEGFDVTELKSIEPGTVLIIDPDNPGNLTVCSVPYDARVAGIVAGGKGLGSGVRLGVDRFDCDVALAGRVYCNVIAGDTPIQPGDLLTTSDVPGYAMRATDLASSQGAILGKAMEPLAQGESGQIMVLVTLQ
jgi:hypothetical protein